MAQCVTVKATGDPDPRSSFSYVRSGVETMHAVEFHHTTCYTYRDIVS